MIRLSKLFRAALLALVAACAMPQFALAQTEATSWTSADGAFSVTIPSEWRTIDAYVGGAFLLALGPDPAIARRERRSLEVCSVEGRTIAGGPFTQAQINGFMDRMGAELVTELRATAVHSTTSETLNGIRVISIDIDRLGTDGGPTRQMQRLFAVPTSSGLMHYQVGCGASGTAYGAADLDAMHGFLASLTLSAGAQP